MKSVKWVAWLGLLVLVAACGTSYDQADEQGCDQVCQQAEYNAIQSFMPAFYNLGTALHR